MRKLTLALVVAMLFAVFASVAMTANATVGVTEEYVMFDLRNYDETNEIPYGKGKNGNCYYPIVDGVEQQFPEVYTWGSATISLKQDGALITSVSDGGEIRIEFDKTPAIVSSAISRGMNYLTIKFKASEAKKNVVMGVVSQGNLYKKDFKVDLTGEWQIVKLDMSGSEGWGQVENYTEEEIDEATGEKKTVTKRRYNPIDFAPWDTNRFSLHGFKVVFPVLSADKKAEYLVDYFAYMKNPDLELSTGATYEHKAYMKGYAGSLFKPNNTMTRAEACTIITRLIADENNLGELATSFTDVAKDAWYFKYIAYLEAKGYLKSYSGEFTPNKPITRAEFVELVFNMGLAKPTAEKITFSDVPETHPKYDAIMAAASAKLVGGYNDGTFLPDRTITRAQVAKVINTALGRKSTEDQISAYVIEGFKDVAADHWAYLDIVEATVNHYTKLDSDGVEAWESVFEDADYTATSQKIKQVDEASAKLKEEIINSKDEIVIIGTKYYVSNNGDDANDGKSPEKAWKTLNNVNITALAPGDAVLFERGGLWRGSITTQTGVTYAAYGEGEKPMFYGSPYDGTGADNWTLVEGTTNVWKFKHKMIDSGTVVFNHGEAHSIKAVPNYKDGKYLHSTNTSKEFNFMTDIADDLGLFCDNKGDPNSECDLYLRSDKGNPGELFTSIEFLPRKNFFRAMSHVKIDNVAIRYVGSHAIGAGAVKGLSVTNCDIQWIGGGIQHYTDGRITRYGNAVELYGGCEDYVVSHNYVHQIYDAGVTHQISAGGTQEAIQRNIIYKNNLFEYCSYSIEYFLGAPAGAETVRYQENVLIENNIMRYAGFGFGAQRTDRDSVAHIKGWDAYNKTEKGTFILRNNVFDRSRYMLIHCGVQDKNWLPTFEDNVWIQYQNSAETATATLGRFGLAPTTNMKFDLAVKQTMISKGIEEKPEVYFVLKDWLWDLPIG